MKDRVEILAPAGSMECLKAAIAAGADAVYTGGALFGARAYAHNLTEEELLEAIDYVHLHGRRLYLTVNTLIKDREMEKQMYDYLLPYYRQGLDAVIVQDIGLFRFIRKHFPDLPIHASTQMTLTGVDGAKFLEKEGAQRIVTSRELSMAEVKKIADETELEICTWCTLLLLFRSVPVQQLYRWQKWQPWTVRTAVQTALPDTGSKETTVSAESQGYLHTGTDPGDDRERDLFLQN